MATECSSSSPQAQRGIRVPVTTEGLVCPQCFQSYDVRPSRLANQRSPLKRWLYSYYRCGICDCRFKEPRGEAWAIAATVVGGGIAALIGVLLIV